MRKGFLISERPAKASTPISTVRVSSSKSITTTTTRPVAVQSAQAIRDPKQLITTSEDRSIVIQENPLILLSDKNRPNPPYFGYFPPGSNTPEMVLIDNDLARIKQAAKWSIWKTPPPQNSKNSKDLSFTIAPVAGKGLAMIATRKISAGELIYKERPIYAATDDLDGFVHPFYVSNGGNFHRSALSRLGPTQQKAFLDLTSCHHERLRDIVPGILSTNNLPGQLGLGMYEDAPGLGVLLPILSRANHSCVPNAHYSFNFSEFTGRFFAVRDIAAGEEITDAYRELLATQKDRKASLFQGYRFDCTCEACYTPPGSEATKASDERRLFIKDIIARLSPSNPGPVEQAEVDTARNYAEMEGLVFHKSDLLFRNSSRFMLLGLRQPNGSGYMLKGLKMLEEAKKLSIMLEGIESPSTISMEMALRNYR